jgi:hypothetical protein
MAATTGRASNQTSANATRATTVHPAAEVSKKYKYFNCIRFNWASVKFEK